MNEATLEARAQSEIKKIFPSYADLEITHQMVFTVNIGRNKEEVKPSYKKTSSRYSYKTKGKEFSCTRV